MSQSRYLALKAPGHLMNGPWGEIVPRMSFTMKRPSSSLRGLQMKTRIRNLWVAPSSLQGQGASPDCVCGLMFPSYGSRMSVVILALLVSCYFACVHLSFIIFCWALRFWTWKRCLQGVYDGVHHNLQTQTHIQAHSEPNRSLEIFLLHINRM